MIKLNYTLDYKHKLESEYNLKVFTNNVEYECLEQIELLLQQEMFKDCKIRIMSDCHSGKGCVIGFTANLGDKVIPNIVGVDIGCGIYCINLGNIDINLQWLDEGIRKEVPAGREGFKETKIKFKKIQELICYRELKNHKEFERQIGTLGSGNHFIELDVDSNENKYLVIHSGSRNLGNQVATYYQKLAIKLHSGYKNYFKEKEELIRTYKEQGRRQEIQEEIKKLNVKYFGKRADMPNNLCYLEGQYKDNYLHDMKICQEYAVLNRETMAKNIIEKVINPILKDKLNLNNLEQFQTIHNYLNFEDNIIRKGAVSANKGEKLIIPINMRDGSLICVGKGNKDWNNSAPHGAGRIMSRSKAKELVDINEYKNSMDGIYTTSVSESTIDEAPMVYKPLREIEENIKDTVDIVERIKPIYNFKAQSSAAYYVFYNYNTTKRWTIRIY